MTWTRQRVDASHVFRVARAATSTHQMLPSFVLLKVSLLPLPSSAARVNRKWMICHQRLLLYFSSSTQKKYSLVLFIFDVLVSIFILLIYNFFLGFFL